MLLAGPRSFCAGVERAIETVERVLAATAARCTSAGRSSTIAMSSPTSSGGAPSSCTSSTRSPTAPPWCSLPTGWPRRSGPRPPRRGLDVVDATCPLVAKVHHEVHRFQSRGYQVVLIGHAGHDETEGTLGEGEGVTLVEDHADIAALAVDRPRQAGLRHPDDPVPR